MTGLDLSRLSNIRRRGDGFEARCPACAEAGHDRSGNHLHIRPDGRFGCAVRPDDHGHRRRVWEIAGGEIVDPGNYLPAVPLPRAPESLQCNEWAELETGTHQDLRALGALRIIGIGGLELASERGVLRFFNHELNGRCWTVTDSRKHVRQDRRLDGAAFRLTNGREAKARTLGMPAWPVGAAEIERVTNITFTEGGPDLLAGHHLINTEGRQDDTAAVAMLGAGQEIHPQAMDLFRGKRIRFFPHADKAGRKAVAAWWQALAGIASKIDAFEFDELIQESGEPVSDLNDFLNTGADQWERLQHVRGPLP